MWIVSVLHIRYSTAGFIFMSKYRLISIFALAALVTLFFAAVESHKRAFEELSKLDDQICTAMINVHPAMSDMLLNEFDQLAVDNPTYSEFLTKSGNPNIYLIDAPPYSAPGNSRSRARGGVIEGSSTIKRDIVLPVADPETDFSKLPFSCDVDKVRIKIECRVPWRFFAGTPTVRIVDLGAPQNEQYIDLLSVELKKRNIEFTDGT